jgi:hypothetical protein
MYIYVPASTTGEDYAGDVIGPVTGDYIINVLEYHVCECGETVQISKQDNFPTDVPRQTLAEWWG